MRNLENPETRDVVTGKVTGLWPTRDDFRASAWPVLRGTAIGSILGILRATARCSAPSPPTRSRRRSRRTPRASAAAPSRAWPVPNRRTNAGAQTSFIPMLTLGIPPNAVMAIMVGAMTIHGIVPGPQIMTKQPDLFWGMIASMWVGNLMLVIINLPLIGLWVKLLKVPYRMLFPAILLFCCIGVYSINNQPFDVLMTGAFGLLGYFLLKVGFEPAPMLIAFVLGKLMEEKLRQAMLISRGSLQVFIERPLSAGFLIVAVLLLIFALLPAMRKKRDEVFVEA